MQKLACREYVASHPDWEIVDEISEKGISGYKVAAEDRDAITELKKRAIRHQFDVLLVFITIKYRVSFEQFMNKEQASA